MKLEEIKNNIRQNIITDTKSIECILKEICNMKFSNMYNNAIKTKDEILNDFQENINMYKKGEYASTKLSDILSLIKEMQVEANKLKDFDVDLYNAYTNTMHYLSVMPIAFVPDVRKGK